MRGIIITNLYPNPEQPNRATFNFQQFEHLSSHCELLVLVPIFPADRKINLLQSTSKLSKTNKVHYFKVPMLPIVGSLLNAKILAIWILIFKKPLIKAFSPDFILGSFAYPDGVAASIVAHKFGVLCFLKVHGTDVNVMAIIKNCYL